jgi:hypothetical protein
MEIQQYIYNRKTSVFSYQDNSYLLELALISWYFIFYSKLYTVLLYKLNNKVTRFKMLM